MLEIIIFFVVICIGLGILKAIWDALSEVLLGLLGLGIIIAAVVFLGPLALGLLGAAIPVILALLPFGLALLAALWVLGCVLRFFQGLKYRGRVRTLKKLGIDKMNGSEEMWARPEALGQVVRTRGGYVVSMAFYKKVVRQLDRMSILTERDLSICCARCAKRFQAAYIRAFLDLLQKEGQLLPYSGQGEEQRYLTGTFVTGCEALFLKEGAATKQEFAQVCAQADAVRRLGLSGRRLASLVLERLLARGEVEKVELADLGEDLYVAKNQRSDAKMTRREISLD